MKKWILFFCCLFSFSTVHPQETASKKSCNAVSVSHNTVNIAMAVWGVVLFAGIVTAVMLAKK